MANIIQFEATKQKVNSEDLKAANILSLFSGIGAGILALKRLKIAINNCIVVEHDSIAEAVCSGNHKSDVDNYIWIETFEELEEKFDEIMEKYAPINIVEGGPPCVECKSDMLSASFKLLSLLPNHITICIYSLLISLSNQCQPCWCLLDKRVIHG